jgi:hypothetical protein
MHPSCALPSPVDFRCAFDDDGLIRYSPAQAGVLGLCADDLLWLTSVGLPTQAAPFLNFDEPGPEGPPLVASVWGRLAGSQGVATSRLIGSNGSGDPVAIEPHNAGAVVYFTTTITWSGCSSIHRSRASPRASTRSTG